MTQPAAGPARVAALPILVLGVLLVYAAWATHDIELPGIYMDSVNPDYLVAKLLNRAHAEPLIAWVLPGNYLADRFPVLVSMYHGLQQFWLGLPLYAIFGMSVAGIRLTHMAFGIAVLVATMVLLARARVPVWIAGLAGIALAFDPAFVFAYRTQSYITMSPVAWLLLSMALLADGVHPATHTASRHVASGVCCGFAVLGYFVYAFYVPAMLLWIVATSRVATPGAVSTRWRDAVGWLSGVAFGCAYYALGYALVARKLGGGIAGLAAYVTESSKRLDAFGAALPLGERVSATAAFAEAALTNAWGHALMFGPREPQPFSTIKLTLLISAPVALLAYAELRNRSTPLLRLLIALPLSFCALALAFGDLLGGHHFVSLLPLAYAALATGLAAALPAGLPLDCARRRASSVLATAGLLTLAAINVAGSQREFETLERTGGVGLYSDAVNRLARDIDALPRRPLAVFPDWGLALPVTLITGGRVASSAVVIPGEARRWLCSGRDVVIAIVGADDAGRFAAWSRAFDWAPPRVVTYAQRDGVAVAQLGVFASSDQGGRACGDGSFGLDSRR
ncbi:MAG: hypothetical protein ABI533_01690 [Betaproteobacteria bacterium]